MKSKMKIYDWNWGYSNQNVPIYVAIEDGGFKRIENLDSNEFWMACLEKYNSTENISENQLCELAKELIERDCPPIKDYPDIATASPLVKELFERVSGSESNMGFIYVEEKEELEEEYGKSWEELKKEALVDIANYKLDDVIEISFKPLAIGYGDLQTRFRFK